MSAEYFARNQRNRTYRRACRSLDARIFGVLCGQLHGSASE